jgi:two-component system chemotaxis response regulator CheB
MAIELLVVGGSSGALDVLFTFLPALPPAVTVPMVVVIHVSPSLPSLMPRLLADICARPVREAEDKEPLAPGTIYIAPPNYHLLVERTGTLALSVDEPVLFSRPSIDVLFESAADAYGERVAGLVLSGGNTDGANGLLHIARRGGLAIVQDPATAAVAVMPAAARARTRDAAHVVAPGQLAPFLAGRVAAQRNTLP